MKKSDYEWYEVWAEDFDQDVPYFLVVTKNAAGLHEVHDIKAGVISFRHQEYQEIIYWLFEDEFSNKVGERTYRDLNGGDGPAAGDA